MIAMDALSIELPILISVNSHPTRITLLKFLPDSTTPNVSHKKHLLRPEHGHFEKRCSPNEDLYIKKMPYTNTKPAVTYYSALSNEVKYILIFYRTK